jgi:hypothetical protein
VLTDLGFNREAAVGRRLSLNAAVSASAMEKIDPQM